MTVSAGSTSSMKMVFVLNSLFPQNQQTAVSTEDSVDVLEIRVDVKGVSCHGSAPERGDNAIYKMADILQDIRALNENDAADTTEIKGLCKNA